MKDPKDEWKKLKSVVDTVFEKTKDTREDMDRHYRMFLGKFWRKKGEEGYGEWIEEDDSDITFNLLFSIVQAQAPLLTDNNPIPTVVPKHYFLKNVAKMYNMGIKYLWEVLEMQTQTMKALIYSMVKKVGIFKVYYDKTSKNGFCCEIVNPSLFFIAPGYDDIWKAPFCGVRERKPLSWIRMNFPDVKDIKAEESDFKDETQRDNFKYGEAEDYELDIRYASVYEVYVKNNSYKEDFNEYEENKKSGKKTKPPTHGTFWYFTGSQFLGKKPSTDDHGLAPYVSVVDYLNPENFLGIDEVDQTEGLIKELNLLYQSLVKYAHQYLNPSYEYNETLGTDKDDIQERLFKGGQIFSKAPIQGDERLLTPVMEARMNPMVQWMFTIIPDIVEELSGITDVSKGEASKKQRQSASEIAILLESSHTRIRQKVRNLEHSLKRICYLFVKLMQQYSSGQSIYNKTEDGYDYSTLSNSKARAEELIASPDQIQRAQGVDKGLFKRNKTQPGDMEAYEDYKNFTEAYGDRDPVYFDFDIQIDTNSTLPLDKQTLANMVIRLAQMQIVDPQAVLETLNFPKWEEIVERMKQNEQQQGTGQGSVQQFMQETGTKAPEGGIPPGLGE